MGGILQHVVKISNRISYHLFHVTKVKVPLGEVLSQGHVEGDLCVVVVVAQVQVFVHVIFNDEGLVAVQTAPPAVRVQQGGERTQVLLAEGCDEALVEAQLVQEDLEQKDNSDIDSLLHLYIFNSELFHGFNISYLPDSVSQTRGFILANSRTVQ